MEFHPYREEHALPAYLQLVVEKSKNLAEDKKQVIPTFVLSESDYDGLMPLFMKTASSLSLLPGFENTPDVHVIICGKEVPDSSDTYVRNIKGTVLSKDLIALFWQVPSSTVEMRDVLTSTFAHEYYHVMRMRSKATARTASIGSCIVEEGLAQVFQIQHMAAVDQAWAFKRVESQLSSFKKDFQVVAQRLLPRLHETDFDRRETLFSKEYDSYDFSMGVVASILMRKKWNVSDPDILRGPYTKILDPRLWAEGQDLGKLDVKAIPESITSASFSAYFLSGPSVAAPTQG